MPIETINDVPGNNVGAVVQSFANDGATIIEVQKKPNGNWDITATKPNG